MAKKKYTMTLRRVVISLEETQVEVETENINDAINNALLIDSDWQPVDHESLIYGFEKNLSVYDYQKIGLISLRDKIKESE